jgi:hypothetical protein
MARNLLDKKWEFETNQGYLADAFLYVLNLFHVSTEDIYIPSFLDMSQIEFRTTKAKKMQIEFVYRRFIDKNLRRNDHILTELEGGDWYAIY